MSEPFWVPLGGAGVDYKGDWAAGSQYQPGDVVRYNGIDYLAVNPSLGTTPPLAAVTPLALVGAKAKRGATQSIPSGTWAAVTWDVEEYDVGNFFAPPSDRFIVPAGMGGYYEVEVVIAWPAATGGVRGVFVQKNTLTPNTNTIAAGSIPGFANLTAVINALTTLLLVPGDFVVAMVYQDSGSAQNVLADGAGTATQFRLRRVGV